MMSLEGNPVERRKTETEITKAKSKGDFRADRESIELCNVIYCKISGRQDNETVSGRRSKSVDNNGGMVKNLPRD